MSSHDYRLGHMLGYNEARGRAEHELAQKDAIIRTMRTAADTKNQIISNYDNAIRIADEIRVRKDGEISKLQATNAALQQSLDEATAKINGESDIKPGDKVRNVVSGSVYTVAETKGTGDSFRMSFFGHLSYGVSFTTSHYEKVKPDDGFRVGDEVKHDSSDRTYQIHALRHNGTEAQFIGYLGGWHNPESSWFPLKYYKKIKEV